MFQHYENTEAAAAAALRLLTSLQNSKVFPVRKFSVQTLDNGWVFADNDHPYLFKHIRVFSDRTEFTADTDEEGTTVITAHADGRLTTNLTDNIASYSSCVMFRYITQDGNDVWDGMESGVVPPMLIFPDTGVDPEQMKIDIQEYEAALQSRGIPYSVDGTNVKILM